MCALMCVSCVYYSNRYKITGVCPSRQIREHGSCSIADEANYGWKESVFVVLSLSAMVLVLMDRSLLPEESVSESFCLG